MKLFRIAGAALAALVFGLSAPAAAQATRTWVSGVGDDANPCSRTAPCKTFAGAISKTAVGGEINCLDPGGFGGVTITRSITIDCAGTLGSVLASNTNGIVINAASADVRLRNLSINGAGNGITGIRIINASSVHVSGVSIFGFRGNNGAGLSVEGRAFVLVEDSNVSGNQAGIRVRSSGGATTVVTGSTVALNLGTGLVADGNGNQVLTGNSTITANATGVGAANGAAVLTYGDNRLEGNTTNGQFSGQTVSRR